MANSISSIKDDAHPVDVAAQVVGGRGTLARLLGVSIAAIGNWKARGVPFEQSMPIETATKGVVTRRMLRPDDWMTHWPELAKAQATSAQAAIKPVVDAVWDGKTERRKLDAPVDRRVSPASVAHAEFLRSQQPQAET